MKTLILIAITIILTLKIIFGVIDSAIETLEEINNKTTTTPTLQAPINPIDEAQFIY